MMPKKNSNNPKNNKSSGSKKNKKEESREVVGNIDLTKISADEFIDLLEKASNSTLAQKKNFTIPPDFFTKLNEFTMGGFILFTLDEDGSPKVYSKFDSDTHALALMSFLKHYADALDDNTASNISDGINGDGGPPDDIIS